jgi:hypothetical protein
VHEGTVVADPAPEVLKAGGITQIAHIDHEQFSVVGVYATSCTLVHGS